jgi:hypothetical protein
MRWRASLAVSWSYWLFRGAQGIKGHKSKGEGNRQQNDGGENVHSYNSSNVSMSRLTRR